jgi:hypothetical protein
MQEEIKDWNRYYVASSIIMLQFMIGERPNELEDFDSYPIKELEDIRDNMLKENKDLFK